MIIDQKSNAIAIEILLQKSNAILIMHYFCEKSNVIVEVIAIIFFILRSVNHLFIFYSEW